MSRNAKSLDVLAAQLRDRYPRITLYTEGHRPNKTDHEPDKLGIVRAIDIMIAPKLGVTSDVEWALSRALTWDPRAKYGIWDHEIASRARADEGWRHYTGPNPHIDHFHLSVVAGSLADDTRPWKQPVRRLYVTKPLLRGTDVVEVQAALGFIGGALDGVYGRDTEAAVKIYQRGHGLKVDGVVGPATRAAMGITG